MSELPVTGSISTRRLLDEPLRVCADTLIDPFGAYAAIRDDQGTIVDFEIVYVNGPAAAILEMPADQQIGARLCERFPAVRQSGYFDTFCTVVDQGTPFAQDGFRRDGRYVDMRVSRLGDGFVASWRDVSSRTRIEIGARKRAEELEVLLDATPAAIWIATDPECREIRGSAVAHELLRLAPTANLSLTPGEGRPIPTHFVVRDRGVEIAPDQLPVQRAARGEEVRGFEEEIVFSSGESVWLYGNAVPLRESDGSPRGAIAAFIDITAYKRIEEELRAASRAKDRFLATISHELRTPLTAVLGYAQMLQSGSVAPERRAAAIETIRRNAELQLRLVNDLLDVSSFAYGTSRLDKDVIAVDEVVATAIDAIEPSAKAKGLRVTRDIAGGATMTGDRIRLQQVFTNVLTNALKFTETGGTISVRLCLDGERVNVVITDDGVGIPPAFLPHVFEPFSQADAESSRRHGGLGLGLHLAHSIVTGHGGTMVAESEGLGRGTTIRIALPRRHDVVSDLGDAG